MFSQLLSKTLDVVGEEEWVVEVGKCFGDQVPLYEGYPEEKVTQSYTTTMLCNQLAWPIQNTFSSPLDFHMAWIVCTCSRIPT